VFLEVARIPAWESLRESGRKDPFTEKFQAPKFPILNTPGSGFIKQPEDGCPT